MAHPSDVTLRMTLGRQIDQMLAEKVERLVRKPEERTAGYIDALRDVQAIMNGGERVPLPSISPTQE